MLLNNFIKKLYHFTPPKIADSLGVWACQTWRAAGLALEILVAEGKSCGLCHWADGLYTRGPAHTA